MKVYEVMELIKELRTTENRERKQELREVLERKEYQIFQCKQCQKSTLICALNGGYVIPKVIHIYVVVVTKTTWEKNYNKNRLNRRFFILIFYDR